MTRDRTLLTSDEVAARLKYTLAWFYRHQASLRRDGFPAPVFGEGRHGRWDPVAIDRWLDAKIAADPDAIARRASDARMDAQLGADAAELNARALALA